MPWRTESVMDQRVEFVVRARQGGETIAGLCRSYGISRPTGYLWLKRYQTAGSIKGLAERSRRPRRSPQQTAAAIAAVVVALRDETGWGGPKIAKVLERRGTPVAPATAQRILKRAGRVQRPAPEKTTTRFAREAMQRVSANGF